MSMLRVLAISGSERSGSWNHHLLAVAVKALQAHGVQVDPLDLRALALPLYDGDFQQAHGVPDNVLRLRDALQAADALLLVTPEYNGFPPPLVVNSFDWLSRVGAEGDKPAGLVATAGKPVALMSASPGLLGGLRSLNYTRQYLSMAFAMMPVPQQFALARANEAFDETGALKDTKQRASVETVIAGLLKVAAALKNAPA